MKNMDIQFPLIDDISMNVAKKYGMIQPAESETKAVRAVFYMDPEGMIRTIIYYPLSLGRNLDELKRWLIALPTAGECIVATLAYWLPGDEVVVPAPGTIQAVVAR